MQGPGPAEEPEAVGGYCIANGFFRRGFESEARGNQVAHQALMTYKGPVKDLWQTTTEPIGSSDGVKHYPRLRDSNGNSVFPAYDGNYNLVGLAFSAPNSQFPDKKGSVITDFEGIVLSSNLSDYVPEKSLNQQSIIPSWLRDIAFR